MTSAPSTLTLESLATRLGELEQEHARKVADLEAANTSLREEVARQQGEIARLQADRADEPDVMTASELILPASVRRDKSGQHSQPSRRTSRRKLLKLSGAAAAAGVAAAATSLATGAHSAHAAPDRPDTTLFWETTSFTADQETVVTSTPATGFVPYNANDVLQLNLDTNAQYQPLTGSQQVALAAYDTKASGFAAIYATSQSGIGVFGRTNTFDAVHGKSTSGHGVVGETAGGPGAFGVLAKNTSNASGSAGIIGRGENGSGGLGAGDGVQGYSDTGVGVAGTSNGNIGVIGTSSTFVGVFGQSTSSIGGVFTGGRAPLQLRASTLPGAPTSGFHDLGELWVDSTAVLWSCRVAGTPGSWVRLTGVATGASGGATTFLASPIRLVDTRGGAPITNGTMPLAGGGTLVVQVTGTVVNVPPFGNLSVPAGASAVVGNLTALPFANGDLTIWKDGITRPNVSNLNYTNGFNIANSVMCALSAAGKVDIYAHVGMTHVIFDVTGYML